MAAIAASLLCVFLAEFALSDPTPREIEVNGVRLNYWDQGSGEPIVFVHGGLSGAGAWDAVSNEIAQNHSYRFITYTQRYYGREPWPDQGEKFGVASEFKPHA